MSSQIRFSHTENIRFAEKLHGFSWPLFSLMIFILALSIIILYSTGGSSESFGGWQPYALSQMGKIVLGFFVFFIAAFTNIKTWLKSSYLIYFIALILIILTAFVGHTGMGAQRWLNLGFIHIQPSELIKIALVLSLARYFAWKNSTELSQPKTYLIPLLLLALPFMFVVSQPDLGTALSLAMVGCAIIWIVGAKKQWFLIAGILVMLTAPIVWYVGMHDYQRNRVITFLNPELDKSGIGYQINQAKIAFGSGGLIGKGFLQGTQSHLAFLPEKQTDFIFISFGEEFGFLGSFLLLMVYAVITAIMFWFSKTCRNRFGQLLTFGFMLNFFTYYFINIAMVLGLLPTVGVPLPLVSFGGSALLSLMFGFGLVQNARIFKDQQLSAKGA